MSAATPQPSPQPSAPMVLDVRDLTTTFMSMKGPLVAVDGVNLSLRAGQALGIIGESGSGKSVTALSLVRLLPPRATTISASRLAIAGQETTGLSPDELADIRGRLVGMIFQDPMTALNPTMRIGEQIAETARRHLSMSREQAHAHAVAMLEKVRIPEARKRADAYPHEMSGGMLQRAMIAMGLSCSPRLIIADEPTTALDVTIQLQILKLIGGLCRETGTSLMLISHDFGVVASLVQRVMVMYAGQTVEQGAVQDIFRDAYHPYTQGLINSMPGGGRDFSGGRRRLAEIPGTMPSLSNPPAGCRFMARCPRAMEVCRTPPPVVPMPNDREVRCWLYAARQ